MNNITIKLKPNMIWAVPLILMLSTLVFAIIGTGLIKSALISLILYSVVFASILIHEFAHVKTAMVLGYERDYTIFIGAMSGKAGIPSNMSRKHMMLATGAGPLSNIVIAVLASIIAYFAGVSPWPPHEHTNAYLVAAFASCVQLNLLTGIFNLIPIKASDGFLILESYLQKFKKRASIKKLAFKINLTLGIGVGIIGIFTDPLFIIVGALILIFNQCPLLYVR
jgi:Zn-dependent protease